MLFQEKVTETLLAEAGFAIFTFNAFSFFVCSTKPTQTYSFLQGNKGMDKKNTKTWREQYVRNYPCRTQAAWNTIFIWVATLWKKIASTAININDTLLIGNYHESKQLAIFWEELTDKRISAQFQDNSETLNQPIEHYTHNLQMQKKSAMSG